MLSYSKLRQKVCNGRFQYVRKAKRIPSLFFVRVHPRRALVDAFQSCFASFYTSTVKEDQQGGQILKMMSHEIMIAKGGGG